MKALLYDQPELALQFIPHTADVNQGDYNQLVPLHVAAMKGYKDVVMQLCLKGMLSKNVYWHRMDPLQ